MGLMYFMPENYQSLEACEGFYIGNKAFFGTEVPNEVNLDESISDFIKKLKRFIPNMSAVNDRDNNMGISRLVLLKNPLMQIVMGDDERYTAIFLIIPESCEDIRQAKREFDGTLKILRNYLIRKYPNAVYKRKNTLNLEPVPIETEGANCHVGRKTLLSRNA